MSDFWFFTPDWLKIVFLLLQITYMVLEYKIGKSKTLKSNSVLELIFNILKTVFTKQGDSDATNNR